MAQRVIGGKRAVYDFIAPQYSVDHLVVGAGVVGLAVAERLCKAFGSDKATFVVERHGQPGQETTSRNSEVIHAGLYYPLDSLKTKLCIRGRELMYSRLASRDLPYSQLGKLIVARSTDESRYLDGLLDKSTAINELLERDSPRRRRPDERVQLERLGGAQARELEPDLSPDVLDAVLSPRTGIVDSHALVSDLENEVLDSGAGEVVYGTRVVRVDPHDEHGGGDRGGARGKDGWVVQTVTMDAAGNEVERSSVHARCLINCAGLASHHILNYSNEEGTTPTPLYYAKGSYFSYKGPGVSKVKHLLYPCPSPGLAGLGTHLTLSLANEVRFGPDVEYLTRDADEQDEDWWTRHLAPSEERMHAAIEAVQQYLPNVDPQGFSPDYVGIRPKLVPQGAPAGDFSIALSRPRLVSLLGIESPGLTASLAIAELVEGIVRRDVWGAGRGSRVSEAGSLDGWA